MTPDIGLDTMLVAPPRSNGPRTADMSAFVVGVTPAEPTDRSQVVHGDLTGNVLFAPGLPPALIDLSLYWRSPSYAEGVVIADALCWQGADASVLGLLGVPVEAVARPLYFRMATTNAFAASGSVAVDLKGEARRYERAALAIGI